MSVIMLRQSRDACGRSLTAGRSPSACQAQLNALVQGQSVMIATNQMMLIVAVAFALAPAVIWLAPKPARTINPAQAGAH
jgi:DHA2 family multidrug resistance protein